ncbi:class I SAM-dependent methyltransferase, partial [Candidatus Microgenomates bacterium]|nr:class I SAM-dependent methyltransferase [Candidatus Microgenomates bacterium]
CGLGLMVYYLRLLGIEAYGVEISKYALGNAFSKAKKYLSSGDINKLPFESNSFDLVTTFDVLEHIETESLKKAVLECNRVAKNHVLHKIFTIKNWWMKRFHGSDLSHVSVYGKEWWRSFFQKLGLKRSKTPYPHLPRFIETVFLLQKKSS